MSGSKRHSVRVVVQHVSADHRDCYRLVAYGDRELYPAVEFSSLELVKRAIHSVAPEFDNAFSGRDAATASTIVFAEAMELDEPQISALGIKLG